MRTSPYTLEPYSGMKSRFTCPECGHQRQFTRYVNIQTNEYIAESVGMCNRINSCGFHFTPKQYFLNNPTPRTTEKPMRLQPVKRVNTAPSFIPAEYISTSIQMTQNGVINHFTTYLENLTGREQTKELIDLFQIGTSKHWPGATVFWQTDLSGRTRTGKIIQYDPQTGKRVKDPFSHITWVHSKLMKSNIVNTYSLHQCLFGLQQLVTCSADKTIGIVESEKTAIIASIYLPELVWLATGGIQNLSSKLLKPISNRKIILFPDLKGYDLWNERAAGIRKQLPMNITVSDLLEQKASANDREKGFDLADYLIKT